MLKPESTGIDYPLCEKVGFCRNGQAGSSLVEVGTRPKGIRGRPRLCYGTIIVWEDAGGG